MNKHLPFLAMLFLASGCVEKLPEPVEDQSAGWPVLRHYDQDHLSKIALPVGGIGTGTVSISGRGDLIDWEIMNRPAKGFSTVEDGNDAPFFALHYTLAGGDKGTRALIGPLEDYEYEEMEGRPVNHHGLPRFREASFDAAYPFGQVHLSDEEIPLEVTMKAFNPLIPGNADDSGIPIAILTYTITNRSEEPAEVTVCGSLRNFIGCDGSETVRSWKGEDIPVGARKNQNIYREENGLKGIFMFSKEVNRLSPAWGTIALSTGGDDVTYRTASSPNSWANAILDFWDDLSDDGRLTEKKVKPAEDDPMASLALTMTIEPGETVEYPFFLTWHFPNRKAWSSDIAGNYYCTQYNDAWDVALKTVPRIPALEEKTISFVNAFIGSSLPDVIKEAALFNVSTLRSQTVFRIAEGNMMGWEGCMDEEGCCYGSCTHVWNYEQTTPFLFGELAMTMREVEFGHALSPGGRMSFRAALPLEIANSSSAVAADGQMGTVMKFYREWQLSGDDKFLEKYWPAVKSTVEFAWEPGSWDADMDGIMEGRQHNTMDVNYWGPNPQMQFWYMGALKAASAMATYTGDIKFADLCNKLANNASRHADEKLFNGNYYEQIIMPPKGLEADDLEFQLGPGCLVDQLAGQYMAHIAGLGYLASPENIATTLESIMEYNFREDFYDHFNNMRSYAMGDESGLLMASWPKGRLRVPFPYFAETMTGFEYTAATGMIYEGMDEMGLKVINAIRDRYDGRRRSPFDEAECGHHYARAMAAWAPVIALSGFHYSAVDGTLRFNPVEGNWFWSNGYSWGSAEITGADRGWDILLRVESGLLTIKKFELAGTGKVVFDPLLEISAGSEYKLFVKEF